MSDAAPGLRADVFPNFQFEIYALGLLEEVPKLPVALARLQERARELLSPQAFGYVAGGAGAERTVKANLEAFERRQIVPRMLRDVSERDLGTSVLGTSMPAPLMLAPVGVQSIIHPEAELASARAAAAPGDPSHFSLAHRRRFSRLSHCRLSYHPQRRRRGGFRHAGPRLVARPNHALSSLTVIF